MELLVVIGIMGVMAALLGPAIGALKVAADISKSANDLQAAMGTSRAYAMANNTYVWVGFYEEELSSTPTTSKPPYPGKGTVIIARVASKDGTSLTNGPLPEKSLTVIGTPMRLQGVHLTDLGAPAGGDPGVLDGRTNLPYTRDSIQTRISSDSSDASSTPFTAGGYTFYKTMCFSPRGEVTLNGTGALCQYAELGLRPTHGSAVDTESKNVIAIQITGIGGNIQQFRP